jgi:hypothetical protein
MKPTITIERRKSGSTIWSLMLRIILLLVVTAGICSQQLFAQDFSRFEAFGGYQYTHLQPNLNLNGWNASVAGNVSSWFGVKLDLSGAYKSGGKMQTYMVGPVFSIRKAKRITPFAHALAGGTTFWGDGSTTGFSMAVGGGLDVNVSDHFAVRVLQADWFPFRSGPDWVKENMRVSTGVVFRF